jgi:hypothetical protein
MQLKSFAIIFSILLTSCAELTSHSHPSVSAETLPVYRLGGASEYPSQLNYAITANHDANHCEFFVNAFGRGSWSHNSAQMRWIEAYLSVDEANLQAGPGAKVLNAGMFVSYRGLKAATDGAGLYLGTRIEPSYYRVRMTYDENVHTYQIIEVRRSVERIAFFVDVQRSNGKIERLWLKNGSEDYSVQAIFDGYPTSWKSLGSGSVAYVERPSPVFNQKLACQNY